MGFAVTHPFTCADAPADALSWRLIRRPLPPPPKMINLGHPKQMITMKRGNKLKIKFLCQSECLSLPHMMYNIYSYRKYTVTGIFMLGEKKKKKI